MQRVTVNIKGN